MAYDLPIVSRTRRNQITKLAGNIGTTSFVDGLGPPPAPPTPPPGPPTGPAPGGFYPTGFQMPGWAGRSMEPTQSPLVPTAAPRRVERPEATQLPYEGVSLEGMDPDIQAAAMASGVAVSQEQYQEVQQFKQTMHTLGQREEFQDFRREARLRFESGLPTEPYRGPMNSTEALLEPFAALDEYAENVAQIAIHGVLKAIPGEQGIWGAERKFNAWAAAGSSLGDDPMSADAPVDMSWDAQRERMRDQERHRQLMGGGLTTQDLLQGTIDPDAWVPGGYAYAIQKSIEGNLLPWYVTEPIKLFADPLELLLAPVAKPLIVSAGALARVGGRGVLTVGGAGVTRLPGASLLSVPIARASMKKINITSAQAAELTSVNERIASLSKRMDELTKLGGWANANEVDKVRALLGELTSHKARIISPPTSEVVYRIDPYGRISAEQMAYDSGPFGGPVWMPEPEFGSKQFASYLEDQPFIGPRLAGNANVHLDGPNRYVVDLPEKTKNLFWFDPIRGGLTNMQNVGATISDMTRVVSRWGMHFDEHGTAAGAALRNNFQKAKTVAAAKSRVLADYAFSAFKVDDNGYIMSLANDLEGYPIDESLRGVAPTIQDVAARMPTYLPHLNATQIDAMVHLKRFSDEINEALVEMGWPPPQDRTDVMDGGFYLHRGSPRPVGEKWKIGPFSKEIPRQTPVSVSSYWRTKSSYRHAEGFESMAEAMQGVTYTRPEDKVKGFAQTSYETSFSYPNFREAMRSYIQQVGEDIAQVHSENYLQIAVDTDSGVRLAVDTKKYLDPVIKKQHSALVKSMQSARSSLGRVVAKSGVLSQNVASAHRAETAQAGRTGRAVAEATSRAERAKGRLEAREIEAEMLERFYPDSWELQEVRRNLKGSIKSAQAIAGNVALMKRQIHEDRRFLKSTDRQIIKLEDRVARILRDAEDHWQAMMMEERPTPVALQLAEETNSIQETVNKLKDIRNMVGEGDEATLTSLKLRDLESALQELSPRVRGIDEVEEAIHNYRIIRTERLKSAGARDTMDIEKEMAKTQKLLDKAMARTNARPATIAKHEQGLADLQDELDRATRPRSTTEITKMEESRIKMVWRQVDRLKIDEIGPEELGRPLLEGAGGDLIYREGVSGPTSPVRQRLGKVTQQKQLFTPPKQEGPAQSFAHAMNLATDLDSATDDLLEQSDILQRELDDMAVQESRLEGALSQKNVDIRKNANRERLLLKQEHSLGELRRALRSMEVEQRRIERVMGREDVLAGRATESAEEQLVKSQLRAENLGVKMDALQVQIDNMSTAWKKSLEVARRPPPQDMIIPLPGLSGYFFPDTVANAARVYLRDVEPGFLGNAYDAFNSLYRGARGTMDNSYMLVQGLLRMYDNFPAWSKALALSHKAWGLTRDELKGERAVDAFFRHATEKAIQKQLPTPDQLAGHGLVVPGADTEFMLGRGFASGLGHLPIIRNANRAFGATGDAMRVEWAYDMLEGMLKTKTLREIIDDGDMASMVGVINNATGWSKGRFGGAAGDLLLFAPRFLNSRFETLGKAIMGTPSLLSQPFGSYGKEWGPYKPTVGQRQASRSMLKMAVGASTMTYLFNAMQGRETDWNPVKKIGKGTSGERWIKNPNFMRVRAFGQDISLLGTWDSLLGLIITSAAVTEEGGPHQAVRSMSSGAVGLAWDFMSGFNGVGEPVRNSGAQIAHRLLSTFMPFSGEEILGRPGSGTGQIGEMQKFVKEIGYDQEDLHEKGETVTWGMRGRWGLEIMGRAGMTVFDLYGGKSYPMSTREQLMELRLDRGKELLERGDFEMDSTGRVRSDDEMEHLQDLFSQDAWFFPWGSVPADIRRGVDDDPEINSMSALRRQELIDRNDQLSIYRTKVEESRDKRNQQIIDAQMTFGNEDPTGPFKDGDALRIRINQVDRDYALNLRRLEADNAQLLAKLERTEEPDAYFDKAFARWAELMYDPDLEDNVGRRDWDQVKENEALFIAEYGEDMKASIRAFLDERDMPIVKEMDALKQTMEPYWDVADEVRDILLSEELPYSEEERNELRGWLRLRKSAPKTADLFTNTRLVSLYNELVNNVRVAMTSEGYPGGGAIDAARIKLYGQGGLSDIRTGEGGMELIETILEGVGSR